MSLYTRIGGEAAIDKTVDLFYDIMLKDKRVAYLFANTVMSKQIRMQKSFLNHVLGGKEYHGKSMKKAHAKLNLTDDHFNAVLENLGSALRQLKVQENDVKEILGIAETTRDDVLGRDPVNKI